MVGRQREGGRKGGTNGGSNRVAGLGRRSGEGDKPETDLYLEE